MSLKWTGERLLPGVFNDTAIEHLARYAFAVNYVSNKEVLDAACGEGYGSSLLSDYAKKVIGIDIDHYTIEQARKKYRKENLSFEQATVTALPLVNNSIDLITSFETIEHIAEQEAMLVEFKRVLKKDGLLIISTPDKNVYRKKADNKFHKKELLPDEFRHLLNAHFNHVVMMNQKMIYGSLITPCENSSSSFQEYSGTFQKIENDINNSKAVYMIALCSDQALPPINTVMFSSEEITKQKSENAEHIKQSLSFKVGRTITFPLRKIRDFIKR